MDSSNLKIKSGGTLSSDFPYYVYRDSDEELFKQLEDGEYCYVLCSRQMGKSSLIVRTKKNLEKINIATAYVQLDGEIGTSHAEAKGWYKAIIRKISNKLELGLDVSKWWENCDADTPNEFLIKFFTEEVIAKISKPVVVFIDEVDVTKEKELFYADDFFRAIRTLYNSRAFDPDFIRISFCLIGAASLNELIKGVASTSWNIGRTIELQDFDLRLHNLDRLEEKLSQDTFTAKAILRVILEWTGGQPYLTLLVWDEFVKQNKSSTDDVDQIINQLMLTQELDRHFASIRKFLLSDRIDDRFSTLSLYQQVWRGEIVFDHDSPAHEALRLSGLVKRNLAGKLILRNRLYGKIFTDEWALSAGEAVTRLREKIADQRARVESDELILKTTIDDYWLAYSAYQRLSSNTEYASDADSLWAGFCANKALHEEQRENLGGAILWRLRALTIQPTELRRCEVGEVANKLEISVSRQNLSNATQVNDKILFSYLSPTARLAFYVEDQGALQLHDAVANKQIGRITRYTSNISALVADPNDRICITGCEDGSVNFWDINSLKLIRKQLHKSKINALKISPDGIKVVSASDDNTVCIWHTDTGDQFSRSLHHSSRVSLAEFSPDSQILATCDDDGIVNLWQTNSGEQLRSSLPHKSIVNTLSFSPDGQILLSGDEDGYVRLWKIKSGKLFTDPISFKSPVRSAAFSPDGRTIVVGSDDGIVRVWLIVDERPLSRPMQHDHWVSSVKFSTDGRRVISSTRWWLHTAEINEGKMRHISSRYFPLSIASSREFQLLDQSGKTTRLVTGTTRDSVRAVTINFDEISAIPVQGIPKELSKEWQKRLGLRINEAGEIVPSS